VNGGGVYALQKLCRILVEAFFQRETIRIAPIPTLHQRHSRSTFPAFSLRGGPARFADWAPGGDCVHSIGRNYPRLLAQMGWTGPGKAGERVRANTEVRAQEFEATESGFALLG
jgi:hypothetical protein